MRKNKMISKAVSLLIALAFTTTVYVPLAAGASDLSAEQKAKKESLEQAEEEAKEDEEHHRKDQYEDIPASSYSETTPSISLTKDIADNIKMREELETEYEESYKKCKQNWGISRKYDGLPYNEFHIRVQEDIRKNYSEIQKKELYLVFSDEKTGSADIWQQDEAHIVLFKVLVFILFSSISLFNFVFSPAPPNFTEVRGFIFLSCLSCTYLLCFVVQYIYG